MVVIVGVMPVVVDQRGIEPLTSRLQGGRSPGLSYRPMAGSREPAVWLSDEAGVTLPQAAAVPLPLSRLDLHPPCSDGKGTHGHQQIESNDPGPIR